MNLNNINNSSTPTFPILNINIDNANDKIENTTRIYENSNVANNNQDFIKISKLEWVQLQLELAQEKIVSMEKEKELIELKNQLLVKNQAIFNKEKELFKELIKNNQFVKNTKNNDNHTNISNLSTQSSEQRDLLLENSDEQDNNSDLEEIALENLNNFFSIKSTSLNHSTQNLVRPEPGVSSVNSHQGLQAPEKHTIMNLLHKRQNENDKHEENISLKSPKINDSQEELLSEKNNEPLHFSKADISILGNSYNDLITVPDPLSINPNPNSPTGLLSFLDFSTVEDSYHYNDEDPFDALMDKIQIEKQKLNDKSSLQFTTDQVNQSLSVNELLNLIKAPLTLKPVDLKRIRDYFKMSSSDFGKYFGISAKTVKEWELGKQKLYSPTDNFIKLFTFFNVQMDLKNKNLDKEFLSLFNSLNSNHLKTIGNLNQTSIVSNIELEKIENALIRKNSFSIEDIDLIKNYFCENGIDIFSNIEPELVSSWITGSQKIDLLSQIYLKLRIVNTFLNDEKIFMDFFLFLLSNMILNETDNISNNKISELHSKIHENLILFSQNTIIKS